MGMMKHYLNNLICACAPESSTDQDALEHAVMMGWIGLAYDLDTDRMTLLGQMDEIRRGYAEVVRKNMDELFDSYEPLLAQIKKAA